MSDRDLEELHAFAAALDMPARAFHGDHYDVPEEWFDEVCARGAVVVSSSEMVRRLRAAGLRLTADQRRARRREGEAHGA